MSDHLTELLAQLDPHVRTQVEGSPLESSLEDLLYLVSLPPEGQRTCMRIYSPEDGDGVMGTDIKWAPPPGVHHQTAAPERTDAEAEDLSGSPEPLGERGVVHPRGVAKLPTLLEPTKIACFRFDLVFSGRDDRAHLGGRP